MTRKLAEKTLSVSEAQYRNLVENSTDWIWETDLNDRLVYSNQQLETILGYSTEEISELSFEKILYPEDLEKADAFMRSRIAEKRGYQGWVLRHRHKDGGYRYLQSNATPVFDATGAVCGFRGIDRDVTLQTLLAKISSDLIKVPLDALDENIEHALEQIARSYGIDRVSLWWFDERSDISHRSHEWAHEGMRGPSEDVLSHEIAPWASGLVLIGQTLKLETLDKIPLEEKADRAFFEAQGVKSLLLIPIFVDQRHVGISSFSTVRRPRAWPEEIENDLRLLAETVANACARLWAAAEISRRAEFQSRLAQLSTDLLATLPEQTDERIEQALETIALDYGLDRIGMWWFSGEPGEMRRHAGWPQESDDNPKIPDRVTPADVPWIADFVRDGKMQQIDDVGDMPAEAHVDQALFQRLGYSSVLRVPMCVEDVLSGCCVFCTFEQRSWGDETIQELQLLADTLANACARSEAAQTIRRREQDLARSEQLARVGSYTFYPRSEPGVFPPFGEVKLSKELRALFELDPSEEASFELFVTMLHADDREQVLDSIRHVLQEGSVLVHQYRAFKPSGEIFYVLDRMEVNRNEDGDITRIFGSQQDITELALREQKLKDALSEIDKLKNKLEEENVQLRQEIKTVQGFDQLVGDSPALRQCLNRVATVAPTDVAVLILGETGTGKELIARAIHDLSPRHDKRLVSINCAALPSELIESELFGHEKGAFTGAGTKRLGRFELADGGTLFLDEIGDLPAQLQGKLLRVLQDGTFERLGGDKTLQVDVRLIAATNRQVQQAVDRGEFRADLYYRINTFPIQVPSLDKRKEDIPVLAEHFVRKHATRLGKSVQAISASLLSHLQERPWPGNIRELEGFIQRHLISSTGSVLTFAEDGETDIRMPASESETCNSEVTNLRDFKRNHILKVLEHREWVIDGDQGAAAVLGIAPSTLRSKLKRYGIQRTD